VVGGSASVAHASSFSWNALNGQFNDSANWDQKGVIDLDGVPDANDIVTFRRGSIVSYTVTFPGTGHGNGSPVDYVTDQLRVGNNNVSFADGNSTVFPFSPVPSTYTVDNPTTAESGRGIIVGETAADTTAVLTTRLATLSAVAATIGDVAGSNGTLNVSAGSFNVTGSGPPSEELIVGRNGTGTITANGGDVSVAGTTWVGMNAGSHGTVNVSNANSTWTSGGFELGFGGVGTVNVTSGGTLNTGGAVIQGGTSVATVAGANSTWTNGGLTVEANGTLNISDDGQVSGTGPFYDGNNGSGMGLGGGSVDVASGGHLATGNGSVVSAVDHGGAVTVTGAGSSWNSVGELDVERTGSISVSAGGYFNSQPGVVIISAGGHVSVQGAGSTWASLGTTVGVAGTLTVSNGGTIGGSLSVGGGGTLEGNGSTLGFINDGIVAPGDSLGALHITSGGYTQHSTGKLQIELGGTTPDSEYDQLLVTGNIALDGTLQVSLVNSFSPAVGDAFNILAWTGTRTGRFTTFDLPALGGGRGWSASQLYTNGVLSVVVVGDYNGNRIVDAADYAIWRHTLGSTTNLGADGDNNGIVDTADYDAWRIHFGQTASSSSFSSGTVPEPSTLVLLMFTTIGWCLRRGRAT
jgi:T5SS/PEP-CTERM-associated repeat protein